MKPSSLEDTRENQDDRYSPTGSARDLYRQEAGAHDNLDGYDSNKDGLDDSPISAGDASADSTQEDRNIADARDKEKNPKNNPMGYISNANQPGGKKFKKGKFWSRSNLRKKGPMGLIIGLFLAGGIGGTIVLVPGLGVIHLKETLMNKLDSQVSAVDRRSAHVMAAKTQAGGSICSGVINIRCKFSSLSDRRIAKLRDNGFKIDTKDSGIPKRSGVNTMSFTDSDGKVHDIKNPGQLRDLIATNKDARSGFRSAYNSRFENFAGRAFKSVMNKIPGVNKRQKIPDTADKDKISKSITEASKGRPIDANNGVEAPEDDEEAQKNRDRNGAQLNDLEKEVDKAKETGIKATTNTLKGAVRGVGALGALDSACVAKNTINAIEIGAKIVRSQQLVNFAMIFLTTADAIKAGDATPSQVSAVGDILTATDEREFIKVKDVDGKEVSQKNPYYKKSAFDSVGYKSAAYGDKLNHNFTSLQYLVGGTPGIGVMSTVTSQINRALGNSPSTTCKYVQNTFVRIISGGIGIVLGAVSGGTWLAISIGASMAVSAAIPFLESMLIDMLAGMAIDGATVGPAAGDAITSGTAFMLMTMAQANGMQPGNGSASNVAYNQSNALAIQDDIDYQTTMARATPWDVNNPYSFIGRIGGALYPSAVRASTSGASTLASIASLPTLALQSLMPNTSAADGGTTCSDPTYESIGLEPQSMCHLDFYMTEAELNMDTTDNVNWMIVNGNIDETTGEPKGDYETYVRNCVERMDEGDMVPFGNTGGDGSKISNGTECLDHSSNTMNNISHFRVYTMDRNISEGMDYEEPVVEKKDPDVTVDDPEEAPDVILTSGEWTRPIKKGGGIFISSRYMTPSRPTHNGVDFAAPMETPYYAVADGVVAKIEKRQAFAGARATQYIVINHGGGISTEYGHSYPDQIKVSVGDTVKAGQVISLVGNQGNIITSRGTPSRSNGFGAHLHFNYVVNGKTVNPEGAMKKHGITL